MKTLDEIPESIRATFTEEEKEAIRLLADGTEKIEMYFQLETGEFDCIGFVGPGGKVTKFADMERYRAILILEDRVKFELRSQGKKWL